MISVPAIHFHDVSQVFVLVRSDKIDAGSQGRLPAGENSFPGTEVIAGVPARACGWVEAVQSVKPNPISRLCACSTSARKRRSSALDQLPACFWPPTSTTNHE